MKKPLATKGVKSVSIIGGADGPTSIFLVGKKKNTLIKRIKQYCYQCKRGKVEAKIKANPHTIRAVIRYITKKYGAIKVPENTATYLQQQKEWKEALIMKYKPELLGDDLKIHRPETYDVVKLKKFLDKVKERNERAQNIPNEIFPMDLSIYVLKLPDIGEIQFSVEKTWQNFSCSYSGNKRGMKILQNIFKDVSLYYGVSDKDIYEKSERYDSLVAALSL